MRLSGGEDTEAKHCVWRRDFQTEGEGKNNMFCQITLVRYIYTVCDGQEVKVATQQAQEVNKTVNSIVMRINTQCICVIAGDGGGGGGGGLLNCIKSGNNH